MGLSKSKNLSTAKKTCDMWFSKYVRIRDANHNGLCKCVTCNTVKHWKEMECGNFKSRRFMAKRWNEQNAHAQCKSCNKYNAGEQYRHGIEIDLLYGEGTADYLEQLSRSMIKLNKIEIMELARYYQQETIKLAKQKSLEL